MAGYRTQFYVDKRRRKISGVCAGTAAYFDIDVNLVRLGALASLFLLGPFAPIAYFITAKVAPNRPLELDREIARSDPQERDFWKRVRRNPRATARSIRAQFRDIERRLAHTEAYLTSPDQRLAREIDRLR